MGKSKRGLYLTKGTIGLRRRKNIRINQRDYSYGIRQSDSNV